MPCQVQGSGPLADAPLSPVPARIDSRTRRAAAVLTLNPASASVALLLLSSRELALKGGFKWLQGQSGSRQKHSSHKASEASGRNPIDRASQSPPHSGLSTCPLSAALTPGPRPRWLGLCSGGTFLLLVFCLPMATGARPCQR